MIDLPYISLLNPASQLLLIIIGDTPCCWEALKLWTTKLFGFDGKDQELRTLGGSGDNVQDIWVISRVTYLQKSFKVRLSTTERV